MTDLHLRSGRREVLQGIDLRAWPGEVTVILGPNGSGKSTLIRAVSGDLPYRGSIRLAGDEVATAPPWRQAARRGVLEQHATVAFPFTVAEVVRLGLHQGTDAAREGIVAAALAEAVLAALADRSIQTLSGGQQARAHLACVRAQVWQPVADDGPRWMFRYEPVASLDIGHQLAVTAIMRRFAQAEGAVVAVMHDLNLSAMVADRIVLLSDGRLLADGPPETVLTDAALSRAYGCALRVGHAPAGMPWVLPQSAGWPG
ncbi:MAG TPA: heme ABC transporter ATP-binding protein [Paracoccaceae bacterium]|nr:heme ABC transporter ATP-binding protein [Paracoccaceae bacterium]